MIGLPYRRASRLVVALLFLGSGRLSAQTQTPGQVTKFDGSLNVVDSGITEDVVGNVGIGTTTPAAKLDVVGGNVNLEDSSVAAGNVLKGGELFIHNVGNENTFLGIRAGKLMMTGAGGNTASGFEALENNTTGYGNTASGTRALEQNTTGVGNTAMGYKALVSNDRGNANTGIGSGSLEYNTTGIANTAMGYMSLWNNRADNNTSIGTYALLDNTTGYENTAAGIYALTYNTTGRSNTALGKEALAYNQTGNENTACGVGALRTNLIGTRNSALGFAADVSVIGLTNATAIGANALVNASNKIRLGDPFVTVIEGQVPYTFVSDRNQKENFQPVDGAAVLRKIRGLNLTSWNYIGHDPHQFRHYGPVAQEFFAAFGQDAVGTIGTSTTINSGDLEGILMVAVQALEKRTAENADLRARIEALEKLAKETNTDGR